MDNQEKLTTQCTQDEERKKTQNTVCVGHHYMQTNTNNINKTSALLQITGGKVVRRKSQWTSQHGTQNIKTHNRTTQKTIKMSNTDHTKKALV